MKTTFAERLQIFINYLETNPRQLEIECDLGNGTLSKVINKGTELGVATINKIKKRHPELNSNWLMDGEGEMLIKKTTGDESGSKNIAEEFKDKYIRSLEDQVEILKELLKKNKP